MKILRNGCFGGYGLSVEAKVLIAEKKGRKIYFFDTRNNPLTVEEAKKELFCLDYTVPNPYDFGIDKRDADGRCTTANATAATISIDFEDRTDKDIIEVVELLGDKANTKFSEIEIVEIPDGIDWEISEYDGIETIEEKHSKW